MDFGFIAILFIHRSSSFSYSLFLVHFLVLLLGKKNTENWRKKIENGEYPGNWFREIFYFDNWVFLFSSFYLQWGKGVFLSWWTWKALSVCHPWMAWMRMRSTPIIITLSFLPQSLAMEAPITLILWGPPPLLRQPASMSCWNVLCVLIQCTLQFTRYVLSPIFLISCLAFLWIRLVDLMRGWGQSRYGFDWFWWVFSDDCGIVTLLAILGNMVSCRGICCVVKY